MIYSSEEMCRFLKLGWILEPIINCVNNPRSSAIAIFPFWVYSEVGKITNIKYWSKDSVYHYWDAIGLDGHFPYGFVGARSEEEAIMINGDINM